MLIVIHCFASRQISFAAALTLEWDPSPDPNIVGYNVYYGTVSRDYTNTLAVGLATTTTVSDLVDGAMYYFAATSVDSAGLESDFSSEVAYLFAPPPCRIDNLDQVYDGTAKQVVVTTTPPGLAVAVTYNGQAEPPTDAGVYQVLAMVIDQNYFGTAAATLIVEQANAQVLIQDTQQVYSGAPKEVWAATQP